MRCVREGTPERCSALMMRLTRFINLLERSAVVGWCWHWLRMFLARRTTPTAQPVKMDIEQWRRLLSSCCYLMRPYAAALSLVWTREVAEGCSSSGMYNFGCWKPIESNGNLRVVAHDKNELIKLETCLLGILLIDDEAAWRILYYLCQPQVRNQ